MAARWGGYSFVVVVAAVCCAGCRTTPTSMSGADNGSLAARAATDHDSARSASSPASIPEEPRQASESDPPWVTPVAHQHDARDAADVFAPQPTISPATGAAPITLAQLESWALTHNPAIRQAEAAVGKAQGIRRQVGLSPNPIVGYQGQQLADAGTDQHLAYIEQEFVLGGKLARNERVIDEDVQSQLWEVEVQRQRTLTDLRRCYFAVLAAQQKMQLAEEFHALANQAVDLTQRRHSIGEASVPEMLQAEIQLNQIEMGWRKVEVAYAGAWRELAAVTGLPHLPPQQLLGELTAPTRTPDWVQVDGALQQGSPELQAACRRVARARRLIERQQVQATPNLELQFGAGYDQGTNSEMMNVQVGLPTPLFNRNQGNISAAQAEFCRAGQELQRLQCALSQRLAQVRQRYESAAVAVHSYEQEILPRTERSRALSEQAYAAGELSFLQVLIVRGTFYESHLAYVTALQELNEAQAELDGYLLTGSLSAPGDYTLDDGLRGQSLAPR